MTLRKAEGADGERRRPYHHGDLRQTALRHAVELLEQEGSDALTMRELAKRVGVTHRALYRWYPDRDALLDTVAAEGLLGLARALKAAVARGEEASARFVEGYLTFVLDRPETYQLAMTRDRQALRRTPAYRDAMDTVIAAGGAAFAARGDAGRDYIMAVVSTLHGLAQLYRAGLLALKTEADFIAYGRTLVGLINAPPSLGASRPGGEG